MGKEIKKWIVNSATPENILMIALFVTFIEISQLVDRIHIDAVKPSLSKLNMANCLDTGTDLRLPMKRSANGQRCYKRKRIVKRKTSVANNHTTLG